MDRSAKRRTPLWARLSIAAGCLLLAPVAVPAAVVLASPTAAVAGPLNFLLVGIDPRGSHTIPLADTILVAHIPADRHTTYLFSLPRDLVVQIPAFAPTGTPAQTAKINAAMALGSPVAGGNPSPAQGYTLLSRTVRNVTGIPKFDAGAIINFGGFQKVVAAMGGVKLAIDQDVPSEHRKPDGTPRDRLPSCQAGQKCLRPYTGPQMLYPKSDKPMRLNAWQSLDFVRQRYGLPRGDYDRQRHQRQFLTAVTRKIRSNPAKLLPVMAAAGDSLTVVGGGHSVAEWLRQLKNLSIKDLTTLDLPGAPLFEAGTYRGEQFPAEVQTFSPP